MNNSSYVIQNGSLGSVCRIEKPEKGVDGEKKKLKASPLLKYIDPGRPARLS
jgi:hypothetical protein